MKIDFRAGFLRSRMRLWRSTFIDWSSYGLPATYRGSHAEKSFLSVRQEINFLLMAIICVDNYR